MIRHSLLTLTGAALLTLASCSPDKTTETTTVDTTAGGDTTVTTTTTTVDTTTYHTYADSTARRIAADLALTDTVVSRKIRRVYHTRAHRLAVAKIQYAQDTAGYYAAMRRLNDDADRELQALVDKDRYKVYRQNRAAYYQGTPYSMGETTTAKATGPAVEKVERKANGEVKIKYADGSKVKYDQDGDRKMKHADGTKVKVGDDGVKVKQ